MVRLYYKLWDKKDAVLGCCVMVKAYYKSRDYIEKPKALF